MLVLELVLVVELVLVLGVEGGGLDGRLERGDKLIGSHGGMLDLAKSCHGAEDGWETEG